MQERDTKVESLEPQVVSSKIKLNFKTIMKIEAWQTISISDAYGPFGQRPNYCFSALVCAFDISIIGQVAKHEIDYGLGLRHANFYGNLMAETVNDGTATVPECEINAVSTTDDWKLGENIYANTDPDYPRDDSIAC